MIYRGHNPHSTVFVKGTFINCDLGSSLDTVESPALALVEVGENKYFRCGVDGKFSEHVVM
ncbi:hypothetical protein ACFQ3N_07510 [Virgibacillus byunsanensis]|uniref:Uncharacterized protein n=1 Tax=Virgibacillus byunsanensis TaxID=570945 RepID=A0ABW3LIN9_9BACI